MDWSSVLFGVVHGFVALNGSSIIDRENERE